MAIARYNNKGYIVVAGTDKYLYAYDVDGGRHWKSDVPYHANSYGTILGIADFNNDGIPEVYTGNQVFSLTNGRKLCDGGTGSSSGILETSTGHSSAVADMDGDGTLEIIAGINIYKVNITNNDGTTGNSIGLISELQLTASLPSNAAKDGATQVADIDNDGKSEVIVTSLSGGRVVVYVWKPLPGNQSSLLGSYLVPATGVTHYSIPTIGNIDTDNYPEIVFITNGSQPNMYALKYNPAGGNNKISLKWSFLVNNNTGYTGTTLFDFNQDRRNEIVYRDKTSLHIIDGSGSPAVIKDKFDNVSSGTLREFPVIADVDNDGQAEIIVTGWNGQSANGGNSQSGFIRVFKSHGAPWAPARKVWNQYGYNALHVNEDLTIPQYPASPAIAFPGDDGILGTGDDVRPYNSFMQQQTLLNNHGTLLWSAPSAILDPSISNYIVNDSLKLTISISNRGDASLGSPVYVTFYKNSISNANIIATDSANVRIYPGESQPVTVSIPNISSHPDLLIIARINDRDGDFPYSPECETNDNELEFLNPYSRSSIKKEATLNSIQDNGLYSNPVSVLFNETILYKITAVNANSSAGSMIIRDTLPAYMEYVNGSASPTTGFSLGSFTGTPARDVLVWDLSNVPSMDTRILNYNATPASGVCVSQPMFTNRAWVTINNTIIVETGSTYHQGAGAAFVTFSTGYGGSIHNTEPQAIDYKTSANEGVFVVPDKGYIFSGWSHDDYISLRGNTIKANTGIIHYDTLTIYGNVELTANFEPEKYSIHYYLNGSENAEKNPVIYTIESSVITLEAPRKTGDVFIGWTGSNGEEPQETVTIPEKSTGELNFYANFLYSGREIPQGNDLRKNEIWASEDELYIRTTTIGSVARIYYMDGILCKQHVIVSDGVTKIKLRQGIYIVTLNNSPGQKIIIE
jgi:uncharacterized repeat protein (TIGR02543 family)